MSYRISNLVLAASLTAVSVSSGFAQQPAPIKAAPSALLTIDQNRSTVVERVVNEWGTALAQSNAAMSEDRLRKMLLGMRADHLLAASLAGNLEGLRNVLANALTSTAEVKQNMLEAKSLGDATDDLVYTPVTPCRIVDTRNVGGPFAGGGETRSYHAFVTTGSFANQGGNTSNCGIPPNPAAAVLNITAVGGGGFLTAWQFNAPQPNASTLNPNPGVIMSNGAIVPLCQPNCADEFNVFTFGAQVVVDIVGYFKPPAPPIGTVSSVALGAGLAGGTITSTGTINLAPTNLLPTTPCAAGQIAKWNGSGWECAADSSDIGFNDARYFKQGGNAFGTTAQLGTIDANPVEVLSSNARVMRYESNATSPNLIGGNNINSLAIGVYGANVGGGGASGATVPVSGFGTCAPDCSNRVTDSFGVVAGGVANQAGDGSGTAVDRPFATVGGGLRNVAKGVTSTIAGGNGNVVDGVSSVITGGELNQTSGNYNTIAGGFGNVASNSYSTVHGGYSNSATGLYSTAAGGYNNIASGDYSFASGRNAHATAAGSFALADSANPNFNVSTNDAFGARFGGGFTFATSVDINGNFATGCQIPAGSGAVACTSTRQAKTDFDGIDARAIYKTVAKLPIQSWRYKGENETIRHIGPMAEDFRSAFHYGFDSRSIAAVDAQGVALAAIKGLAQELDQRDARIEQLTRQLKAQRKDIDRLKRAANRAR